MSAVTENDKLRFARQYSSWRRALSPTGNTGDAVFRVLMLLVALFMVGIVVAMVIALAADSLPSIRLFGFRFLTTQVWNPIKGEFGALPFIYGTIASSLIALLISVPFSLGIAIFLVEQAPPYIARPEARESDRQSYQTVYAAERGAIAAPTAGLHFTPEILEQIARRNEIVRITLHVGIGTFEPVKVDDLSQHVMHSERYEIGAEAAKTLNAARSIVAVGTTTVRTLESAVRDGRFEAGRGETDIFITPGYRFKVVDKLLTNFHLPESTLLMLVSAFAGSETVRRAYSEAIVHRYLFYSYGDCMFITRRVN